MDENKVIKFIGYDWTLKEFAGIYLLESFTNELSLSLEEYAPNKTSKEVAIKFMGEARFNQLIDEGFIEYCDGNNNYKPTTRLYNHSNDFLSCIIDWLNLVEDRMETSLEIKS